MNKAEKKFRLYAIFVIFVLLTVLLAIINAVSFTMASEDADVITQMIAERQGSFDFPAGTADGLTNQMRRQDFRMGPMGPTSPDMNASVRYFTFGFPDGGGVAQTVAFHISAITEDDARQWASELLREGTGWTRGTYRYRVYRVRNTTYVTVIDQGRELLPSYRILIVSAAGEVLCLIVLWFVLLGIGRKIYAPIEEADRKQRNFVRSANREFRLPLTVISGNTELLERKFGPDDITVSTRRQIGKLSALVDGLEKLEIYGEGETNRSDISLSSVLSSALELRKDDFASASIELAVDIEPDVIFSGDPEKTGQMVDELVDNTLKFAVSKAEYSLRKENGYVVLETKNDADLPDGPADQVFDRFTVLGNAQQKSGSGLGLACVKEIVKAHKGRATALVSGGIFDLRITM